jgi:adenine deaminase
MEEGVDPVTAIQTVTINVARYFKLEHDLGSITPGKCADILLIDDLQKMEPSTVITDGQVIAEQGELTVEFPVFTYPAHIRNSMNVKRELTAEDFKLESRTPKDKTLVHVIKVIENSARTEKMTAELTIQQGIIQPETEQDIVRLACVERHRGTGQISLAFAHGFQVKTGAVASTVAHDSHNLLVMGIDEADMAFAANELIRLGGGTIVVENGVVLAQVPLTIAGLMSDKSLSEVVEEVTQLDQAWKHIGCSMNAPFMTFSLIALPVIPEIRISNRGLVDVTQFKLIDVEIV